MFFNRCGEENLKSVFLGHLSLNMKCFRTHSRRCVGACVGAEGCRENGVAQPQGPQINGSTTKMMKSKGAKCSRRQARWGGGEWSGYTLWENMQLFMEVIH